MGWFSNKTNKSELSLAIDKLASSQSVESQRNFANILSSYVENKTWVHMLAHKDEDGYSLKIVERRGKHFAAMCSDETEVKKDPGFVTVLTDINKLIDPVFQNDFLEGVIINPYTSGLCVEKHFLLKCLLHAKYPEQKITGSPSRNWGEGIPAYKQSDLMTDSEIQNFALHTVLDNDEYIANNFERVSVCDYPSAMPSMIFKSKDGFAFVFIKGHSSLTEPTLTAEERKTLLSLGKKYNAKCYFATVGFLSTDPARFEAELALRGDGFYCKYEGLQIVE